MHNIILKMCDKSLLAVSKYKQTLNHIPSFSLVAHASADPVSFSRQFLLNTQILCIVSLKVFRTRLVFTPRRWICHERVNTDEHRTHDNVRAVRDRPKNFYSNNSN